MAVIKNISSLFIAVFIVANDVEAQSTISYEDCLTASDVNAAGFSTTTGKGNLLTSYELLCGVTDTAGTTTLTVDPNSSFEFTKLCSLLSTGTITKSDGVTVNFQDFLSDTLAANKGHTLFAPTDAAFDAIGLDVVTALLDSSSSVSSTIRNDLIARWMELHVLPDSYLSDQFNCNQNFFALNPSNTAAQQQVQKTRCAGTAGTFQQIGGGNVGALDQPTVGAPAGVFDQSLFLNTNNPITMVLTPDATDPSSFDTSSNLITCNGVVHVVDVPLRPGRSYGYYGAKGAKGYGYYSYYGGYYGKSKGAKGYGYPVTTTSTGQVVIGSFFGGRALGEETGPVEEPLSEVDRNTDRENRRARLESLLVDANGNIESMD